MTTAVFAQILWSSITFSTFYVLFAVAFALYLKVAKVWNFSQAGLISVAYLCLFMGHREWGLPAPIAIAGAIVVVAAVAIAIEHWGFRVLRSRASPHLAYFILSFMIAEFLIFSVTMAIGTEPRTLSASLFAPAQRVMGIMVTQWDMGALATTGVIVTLLLVAIARLSVGRQMVAVADNASLAALFRIKPERIYLVTTVAASVLLVFGCWLYGTKSTMAPAISLDLVLVAVISCILGGVGSIGGAAFAAVIIGILKGFSIFIVPSIWQNTLVYYVLFAVIILVPNGIRLPAMRPKLSGMVSAMLAGRTGRDLLPKGEAK